MSLSAKPARIRVRAVTAALFASVMLLSFTGTASARPVAEFTTSVVSPHVAQRVTMTYTGTCDVAPCRIQWRWYKAGGSRLGVTIGEGRIVSYSFPAIGNYSVVVKAINATRTHAFSTMTHVIAVRK